MVVLKTSEKFPKCPSNTAALTGRHFLSCFYNMLLVAVCLDD